MTPIRNVLALDNDAPICAPCTTALGGTKVTSLVPAFDRICGHCGNIRPCVAVGDVTWPAALIRPEPDDYSELETLLSRGVAPRI